MNYKQSTQIYCLQQYYLTHHQGHFLWALGIFCEFFFKNMQKMIYYLSLTQLGIQIILVWQIKYI